MADDYRDYYETPIGWDAFNASTGRSAGYDPGAYFMYGEPEGFDAYQTAQRAYGAATSKAGALQILKEKLATPQGRQWLDEDSGRRDLLADAAGVDRQELWGAGSYGGRGQLFGGRNEVEAQAYADNLISKVDQSLTQTNEALGQQKTELDALKGKVNDPFNAEVNRQLGLADEARNREAVQMDRTEFDADRARELEARGGMLATEGTLRDWVAGKGPSAAQSQFQSGLDQSIASQMAMANSARGGGFAQAAARQAAGAQGALQRMQGVSQAASLRAQEMQSAMGQLQSQGYNIRAQDQTRSAQGAEWEDAQARLSDAQRARNDATSQYYEGMRQQAYANQANMKQAGDQARQADFWKQRMFRKDMEDDDFQRDMMMAQMMAGIGSKVAAGAAAVAAPVLAPAAVATVANSGPSKFTGGGSAAPAPAPGGAYGFNTPGQYNPGGATSNY